MKNIDKFCYKLLLKKKVKNTEKARNMCKKDIYNTPRLNTCYMGYTHFMRKVDCNERNRFP